MTQDLHLDGRCPRKDAIALLLEEALCDRARNVHTERLLGRKPATEGHALLLEEAFCHRPTIDSIANQPARARAMGRRGRTRT